MKPLPISRMRLAVIATHPVQYNAPWFRLLAETTDIIVKVFYTWSQSEQGSKYDPGFGIDIEWDIPLLNGYDFEFVFNVASRPGSDHFFGVENPGLIKTIDDWKPNALLVFGWNFKSHLKAMRHFKGKIPIIFRGDSTLLDSDSPIKKFLRQRVLRWVYRHVDYALFVGSNNRDYYLSVGLTEHQLIYAPHAVDNDRFSDPSGEYAQKAEAMRLELGLTKDDFVILFAGKFEAKKNPEFLLKLAKEIRSEHVKFLFVGDGDLRDKVIDASRNDPRIYMLGFQNQTLMPVVYRMCDVFILPSRGPGETWGLSLNEAMASGRPVIASTKVGGAADLIDSSCGRIIDLSRMDAAVAYINELRGSRNLRISSGEAAISKIKKFSFSVINDSIKGLLVQLDNGQNKAVSSRRYSI